MKRLRMRLVYVLSFALLLVGAGCKQGLGEHCQVDEDCCCDLECSSAGICREPVTEFIDASVIDARIIDGGIDAAPPIDASTIDAEMFDAPP